MAGGRVSHGRVIVEGFIDFDYEITLLTVRAIGAGGEVETHFCDPIGHVQVSGDYVESWQPHPMAPAALERAREIAKAVTDNLGGDLGGSPGWACSASSCSSRATRSGSARSARARTTPAW